MRPFGLRQTARLAAVALLASVPPAFAQPAPAQTPAQPQAQPQARPAGQAPAAAPAQSSPAPATAASAAPAADPVLATVNGTAIRMSDVNRAAQGLPPQLRGLPPQTLIPMVLDQLVDQQAVVDAAEKEGLSKDPAVKAQMTEAAERALQAAYIRAKVAPQITEEAIKARYDQEYANKPGEEEVHARHILVPTKAEAEKIIAELNKGADFATLAKQYSKDPAAAQGGDLGFFKKSEMLPEFANAAFALKPGEYTKTPVKTVYGWHVIKVEAVRQAPPKTFEQAHDEIRQQLIQEAVTKLIEQARAGVKIERFNMDGSPVRATDSAEPPPAPKP